jgi:hypothetical protein
MAVLSFVGLAILWVVGFLIIGSIFNTYRVKNGQDINDPVTDFVKGLALGPFAILSGLDPRSQKNGKSKGLISGGIVGMVSFFITYFSL